MNEQLQRILDRLDEREQLQPLSPRDAWDKTLETRIEALDLGGKRAKTPVITLIAGLHLRNDSLDRSHSYAQQIEHDPTGAYWHGIMHRMEGDYGNAKYWFMRTGRHPVMAVVKARVAEWLRAEMDEASVPDGRIGELLQSYRDDAAWAPSTFVDLAAWQEQRGSGASDATRRLAEHIQHIEMTALFEHTLQAALALE